MSVTVLLDGCIGAIFFMESKILLTRLRPERVPTIRPDHPVSQRLQPEEWSIQSASHPLFAIIPTPFDRHMWRVRVRASLPSLPNAELSL